MFKFQIRPFLYRIGSDDDPGAPGEPSDATLRVTIKKDNKGRPIYVLPDGSPLITQNHLNTLLATTKREAEAASRNTLEQLEAWKARAETSESEKELINAEIRRIKEASMSESERLKAALDAAKEEHTTALTAAQQERDQALQRYQQYAIQTEITQQCIAHRARSAETVVPLIASRAKVVDVLDDDGKPTGVTKVIVPWEVTDSKGKTATKELTVAEVMTVMKADETRYAHLFDTGQRGGSGTNHQPGPGGKPDLKTMDPSDFQKNVWNRVTQGT